jgi:hypothetical protein
MTGLHVHRLRAAFLAITLLLPLLHGVGAHLARPAAAATGVSTPSDTGVPDAADEVCTLCVAGRTASGQATTSLPPAPVFTGVYRIGRAAHQPVATAYYARPDAPRGPPHRIV